MGNRFFINTHDLTMRLDLELDNPAEVYKVALDKGYLCGFVGTQPAVVPLAAIKAVIGPVRDNNGK